MRHVCTQSTRPFVPQRWRRWSVCAESRRPVELAPACVHRGLQGDAGCKAGGGRHSALCVGLSITHCSPRCPSHGCRDRPRRFIAAKQHGAFQACASERRPGSWGASRGHKCTPWLGSQMHTLTSQCDSWRAPSAARLLCRYHEQPGYEPFAALLSKPKEDAAAIVASRFPVPRVVDADNFTVQGRSQSRFLLARLNPSSTHSSAGAASEVIFTDDVSLEVFLEHLKTLSVQS